MNSIETEYDVLDDAPSYADAVASLARWSQNYDHPTPYGLFLDIIGWSDDEIGEPLFDLRQCPDRLGYLEIDMLADALHQYADAPGDVRAYVDRLAAAE